MSPSVSANFVPSIDGLDALFHVFSALIPIFPSSVLKLRYLRATKWKSAGAAITRLETTLKWRRDFGLYDLVNAAHVEPEVCAIAFEFNDGV